jgi:hypothetical protein
MAVTETEAVMPQAVITDEVIAMMAAKAGSVLRIDHSVNNELASTPSGGTSRPGR